MKALGIRKHSFLNQILGEPGLVQYLQALPPEKFHLIVDKVGLEDCGELVSAATTRQLEALFDIDLWRNEKPGESERFDSARFLLWIEILLEGGEDLLVKKIMELDDDLLLLGVAPHIFVISTDDLQAFFAQPNSNAEQVDVILESCLYEELYEYQIVSKTPETWDVLFTLLVALEKADYAKLMDLLEQLCVLTTEEIDGSDLYTVLSSFEALTDDMAGKREDRRSAKGYVSAQDARSFLQMTHTKDFDEMVHSDKRDAITAAYFRYFDRDFASNDHLPGTSGDNSSRTNPLMEIFDSYYSDSQASFETPLLTGQKATNQSLLTLAMYALHDKDPLLHSQRLIELSYMANCLAVGSTLQNRRFRNVDASLAAFACCALGAEILLSKQHIAIDGASLTELLKTLPMEKWFLLGWKALRSNESNSFPYISAESPKGTYLFCDSIEDLPRRKF